MKNICLWCHHKQMFFTEYQVGCHVPLESSVYKTVRNAVIDGMNTCQFFLGPRTSMIRRHVTEDDIKAVNILTDMYPIDIFTHAPYIYNLAGSAKSLAWNGDNTQDIKTLKMLKSLEYELNVMSQIGKGVVIHPGSNPDRKAGLLTIAKSINKICFAERANLILENAAGEGTKLCTTIEEMKFIYDNIDEDKRKNVSFCLDTAHIHGYGEYDLTKVKEVNRLFSDFDKNLGLNKLSLIHLNDSKVSLGSKKDRHELLCQGQIWLNNNTALIDIFKKSKKYGVSMVIETITEDMNTVFEMFGGL